MQSFHELALAYAADGGRAAMLPVIEKELLHYGILDDMDRHGFLSRLTFQGGTCLRLCYGSERYSEDLDFAGGAGFVPDDLDGLSQVLRDGVSSRYGVDAEVSQPSRSTPDSTGLTVDTWRITVVTAPARPDLPRQRISVQVANVPAHTRQVRPLRVNYPDLPASFSRVLVVAESAEEICADKLKAFITSRFVRYRDLWDVRWLALLPGFESDRLGGLLAHKLDDYQCHDAFRNGLRRLDDLEKIVNGADFGAQLGRFLPAETVARTIDRSEFRTSLVDEVTRLYGMAGVR